MDSNNPTKIVSNERIINKASDFPILSSQQQQSMLIQTPTDMIILDPKNASQNMLQSEFQQSDQSRTILMKDNQGIVKSQELITTNEIAKQEFIVKNRIDETSEVN